MTCEKRYAVTPANGTTGYMAPSWINDFNKPRPDELYWVSQIARRKHPETYTMDELRFFFEHTAWGLDSIIVVRYDQEYDWLESFTGVELAEDWNITVRTL